MLFRERQLMNSFKPGDWIKSTRYPNLRPIQIISIYESNTRPGILGLKSKGTVLYSDEVELWQPKVSEWCWFINTDCAPLLAQFVKMQTQSFWINNEYKSVLGYKANKFGHYSGNIGPVDEDYVFVYCEPFIGQLPTSLKDQS